MHNPLNKNGLKINKLIIPITLKLISVDAVPALFFAVTVYTPESDLSTE